LTTLKKELPTAPPKLMAREPNPHPAPNYHRAHIHNEFLVSKFAKEIEVHPSFIYTAFQHFQKTLNDQSFYGAFRQYFPDYYLAIKNLNPVTWKENSISEIATNLKSIFELNQK
jgi:hypothetical protein